MRMTMASGGSPGGCSVEVALLCQFGWQSGQLLCFGLEPGLIVDLAPGAAATDVTAHRVQPRCSVRPVPCPRVFGRAVPSSSPSEPHTAVERDLNRL